MGLSCGLYQTLLLDEGYGSIFVKFESLLEREDVDFEKSILQIASSKNVDKYHDLIDFTFVELFPEWKGECFRFYKKRAVALKDHPSVTKEMISKWDDYLCNCAQVAINILNQDYLPGWKAFRLFCHCAGGGLQLSLEKEKVFPTKHLVKEED